MPLVANAPRVTCTRHGVITVDAPWAEPVSGFTSLFEALVIDWLKEALILADSRQMKLNCNTIECIMQRAVCRELEQRDEISPERIEVDTTSFR